MKKNDLKGKKLLYLGGIPRARFVVERARSLGIYVIVADYNDDSPAKVVADESALIDAMNIDALVSFGRDKKIDGIMTGYCDILMPICKAVSDQLGLPCYYTDEMLRMATDKECFGATCRKYGIPVPETYNISPSAPANMISALPYPVFIKPLDASGSRGASVCSSSVEFKDKYEYARLASHSGSVVVEEMLYGTEFILDYAICDGKPYLLSMADRYVYEGHSAVVNSPNLMVLPSKHLEYYRTKIEPAVQEMFAQEHFNDGIFFLQGYVHDDRFAFYECGCRLGGTWPYIDEHFYGINPMDLLFRHSVTGNMLQNVEDGIKIDARYNGNAAIIYFCANRASGRISKIIGIDQVGELPYVVHLMEYYKVGDVFDSKRSTDVRFAAVHLVAENFNGLKESIKKIYSLVDYLDETGVSILQPRVDVDTLIGY